ncbi:MAG: hypothetical protein SFY80_00735 [Verrucomicrobiota bacterium]|nr:hypothetical protein [Verrucomicrobiota bacterium]
MIGPIGPLQRVENGKIGPKRGLLCVDIGLHGVGIGVDGVRAALFGVWAALICVEAARVDGMVRMDRRCYVSGWSYCYNYDLNSNFSYKVKLDTTMLCTGNARGLQ